MAHRLDTACGGGSSEPLSFPRAEMKEQRGKSHLLIGFTFLHQPHPAVGGGVDMTSSVSATKYSVPYSWWPWDLVALGDRGKQW